MSTVESFTGIVVWDEEEEAFLLRLDNRPDTLLHCGALVPGVLENKRVKVTIELVDIEVLS